MFMILRSQPTVFLDPSFGFCLGIKSAEITGRTARLRPGHLHAPTTPRLDWLHYKLGTHQSELSDGCVSNRLRRRQIGISAAAKQEISAAAIVRQAIRDWAIRRRVERAAGGEGAMTVLSDCRSCRWGRCNERVELPLCFKSLDAVL
jgi:hypothetical protein